MLKVNAEFDLKDLYKEIDDFTDEVEEHMLSSLRQAGKQFVDRARSKVKGVPFSGAGFGNITWDLRGSIGYVIVKNHHIIERYFPFIGLGDEGTKQGHAYAEEVALLIDEGDIMLIVVAGMDYAYYVEAKGYDVISGSSDHFETEFLKILGR